MDILQNLVRVNSLLLQGQYEGAEHVLDGAIVDARGLLLERDNLKTALDGASHDSGQMATRMGEMAAEIERLHEQLVQTSADRNLLQGSLDDLNAEREQLLAQEPEWVRNLRECASKGDAHANAYFTLKPSEVIYLIDRAIPAQQMQDNWLINTARQCADDCSNWPEWRKQAVINAMQQPSPAVAVPSTLCKQLEIVSRRLEKDELLVLHDTVNLAIAALSSTRITEQDAREIINSYAYSWEGSNVKPSCFNIWHENLGGRHLLNKLNGDHNV